jgi:hypothetical protein
VKDRFAEEQRALLPLPAAPFMAAEVRPQVTVTRRALVQLEGATYSVWSTWNRLTVTAYLGVHEVELVGPDGRRVRHPRMPFGRRSIDYRHYLPELARKPQALRQVAAELVQVLGPTYERAWRHLVDENGPKQAARVFAQVVRAVDKLGTDEVAARVDAALARGEPLQLAVRLTAQATPLAAEALPESVRGISVEAARAADFDALLRGAA